MSDRRYSDDEVSQIFAKATELPSRTDVRDRGAGTPLPPSEGMSLVQLQDIAREAGIAPELVAEAARDLDRPAPPKPATFLGLPIGVARTVDLERRLTDDEWDAFVVQLRETFNARGKVTAEGSLRSWHNGNLQISLEPNGDGHRVRMRTTRGNTRQFVGLGLGFLALYVTVGAVTAITSPDSLAAALSDLGGIGALGGLVTALGAVPLPFWLRARRQQMEQLELWLRRKQTPTLPPADAR